MRFFSCNRISGRVLGGTLGALAGTGFVYSLMNSMDLSTPAGLVFKIALIAMGICSGNFLGDAAGVAHDLADRQDRVDRLEEGQSERSPLVLR